MKTKRFLIAVMAAMMVFAFGATTSFAGTGENDSFTWSKDYSSCIYTDEYGEDYEATVTSEVIEPTCEEDGVTIYEATFAGHTDTQYVDIEATGHEFSDPTWALLDGEMFKVFTCTKCGDQKVDTRTNPIVVEFIDDAAATCESDGVIAHYEGGNKYFTVNDKDEVTEVAKDDVTIPAKGHKYQTKYSFAKDGSACDAKATCSVCGDVVRSNAEITKEVTKPATSTTKGETTYTAKFYITDKDGNKVEDEIFETQTLVVADVDYVWEMKWADYTVDNAYAQKFNGTDLVKVSPEAIEATTEAGVTTYVATFKKDSGIQNFTTTVENPSKMVVKAKTVKAKAKKVTKISADKVFVVTDNAGNVTYKKESGSKKITVVNNGNVTVKKGLKKGIYKVKVTVADSGTDEVMAGSKTVTLKVKVK